MLTPLRSRPFFIFWLSLVGSGIGQMLLTVGVLVSVFDATGSAFLTAGVMVAETLPHFLLGPFAGALVDRWPRQRVMLLAQLTRAGMIALLLWQSASVSAEVQIALMYVVVLGLSTTEAFFMPARQAIIPQLVGRDLLVRANSLVMATAMGTQAIGFALGGLMVVWFGFELLGQLSVAFFVLSALLVLLVRTQPVKITAEISAEGEATPSMWTSIRQGMAYLRHEEPARTLVIVEVIEHIPHGVWTAGMMLVFVEQALNGTPTDWGLQNAAWNIGVLIGTFVATAMAGWLARYPGWIIIGNAAMFSLLTISYAFSPSLSMALALSLLLGPTFALRDVAQDSLLQATVAEGIIGRVYALRSTFANLNFMLAGLVFAYLADIVSVRLLFATAGVLYMATAVYSLSKPAMRNSRIDQQATPAPVTVAAGD